MAANIMLQLERMGYDLDQSIQQQQQAIDNTVSPTSLPQHQRRNQLLSDELQRLSVLAADAEPLRAQLAHSTAKNRAAAKLVAELADEVELMRTRETQQVAPQPSSSNHCEALRLRAEQCAEIQLDASAMQEGANQLLHAQRAEHTVKQQAGEQAVDRYVCRLRGLRSAALRTLARRHECRTKALGWRLFRCSWYSHTRPTQQVTDAECNSLLCSPSQRQNGLQMALSPQISYIKRRIGINKAHVRELQSQHRWTVHRLMNQANARSIQKLQALLSTWKVNQQCSFDQTHSLLVAALQSVERSLLHAATHMITVWWLNCCREKAIYSRCRVAHKAAIMILCSGRGRVQDLHKARAIGRWSHATKRRGHTRSLPQQPSCAALWSQCLRDRPGSSQPGARWAGRYCRRRIESIWAVRAACLVCRMHQRTEAHKSMQRAAGALQLEIQDLQLQLAAKVADRIEMLTGYCRLLWAIHRLTDWVVPNCAVRDSVRQWRISAAECASKAAVQDDDSGEAERATLLFRKCKVANQELVHARQELRAGLASAGLTVAVLLMRGRLCVDAVRLMAVWRHTLWDESMMHRMDALIGCMDDLAAAAEQPTTAVVSPDWLVELLQTDPSNSLSNPDELDAPIELTQWLEEAKDQLCSVQMKAVTSPTRTSDDKQALAQFRTQIGLLEHGVDVNR